MNTNENEACLSFIYSNNISKVKHTIPVASKLTIYFSIFLSCCFTSHIPITGDLVIATRRKLILFVCYDIHAVFSNGFPTGDSNWLAILFSLSRYDIYYGRRCLFPSSKFSWAFEIRATNEVKFYSLSLNIFQLSFLLVWILLFPVRYFFSYFFFFFHMTSLKSFNIKVEIMKTIAHITYNQQGITMFSGSFCCI